MRKKCFFQFFVGPEGSPRRIHSPNEESTTFGKFSIIGVGGAKNAISKKKGKGGRGIQKREKREKKKDLEEERGKVYF